MELCVTIGDDDDPNLWETVEVINDELQVRSGVKCAVIEEMRLLRVLMLIYNVWHVKLHQPSCIIHTPSNCTKHVLVEMVSWPQPEFSPFSSAEYQ